MNIPATGPNEAKAKFFREIAQAFQFLSVFHSLPKENQEDLLQHITKLQAKTK